MKKIIGSMLLVAGLIGSQQALGQAQFAVGLKGGLNFANIKANAPGETYDARTGYHFGAFALIKLTKIGIQPELIFSQQGSKIKSPTGDYKQDFSYVNIPVILKLYTVAGINLQAGPQFGFLTSAKADGDDIKSTLKGSDISLALGVGWDLPFGLTVDGRYNLGLSKVNDGGDDDVKNQVWQVSVGYKLFKFGN